MLAHRRIEAQVDYHYPMVSNLKASRAIGGATDGVMASVDTVRTYIDQNGTLQTVSAADDYRISHVLKGSRLEPALLLENIGTQLLFAPNTFTAAAGWTLSNVTGPATPDAIGPDGTLSAWTMVDASGAVGWLQKTISKSVSDSTTPFIASVMVPKVTSVNAYPAIAVAFAGVATKTAIFCINPILGTITANATNNAANIVGTIIDRGLFYEVFAKATDNGANTTVYWQYGPAFNEDGLATAEDVAQGSNVIANAKLTTGSIPSSYFAGAAAIGAELVQNGSFAAVVDNVGELATGVLTVGNCYKISAHTDTDFTTVGAPDSNVGTYFNATATGGAGILDAGDKVYPVTFINWIAGTGWAPQATAGSLTGKAQHTAGTASTIQQSILTAGKVYRFSNVATRAAGSFYFYNNGLILSSLMQADGTYYYYRIATGIAFGVYCTADFAGTIDDVSVMEHGTVRLSEAAKLTFANPTKLIASLADEFTIVGLIRFNYAKTQVTSIAHLLAFATSGFFYHDASGVLTITDGTNLATNTTAYVANTWYRFEIKGSGSEMSLGIQAVESAVSWGSAGTFDGAITTTGNVIYPGYTIQGAFMLKDIFAFQGILSNQQIKRLPILG